VLRVVLALAFVACLSPVEPIGPTGSGDTSQLRALEATADLDGAPVGRSRGPTLAVVFASWCTNCHTELAEIDKLRAEYPALRVLGLNYRGHEEYDGRGNAQAVRRYVAQHARWLRVVPIDDAVFDVIGRPPLIPTIYVYDSGGQLVAMYSRKQRRMPDANELRELLAQVR
jgi:thiol-disulfide isomerase/thioredoxin